MMPSPAVVSDELAQAALECPALSRAHRLAGWVGSGKELTASGVLRPAAAVEACQVLGISLPKARLRSALDVDELMRVWLVALEAGFVVSDGRRARAVPGSATMTDPERVLTAWLQAAARLFGIPGDLCAGCVIVLHELHAAGRPLSMDELASAIGAAEPGTDEPCPDCGEVHELEDQSGLDLFFMDSPDEEDDLEHAVGTVTGLADFGAAVISAGKSGGRARLTPLGSMLATAVFEGCAPAPDADAKTLLAMAGELPPPVAMIMAEPWFGARSADAAVRELLTFAESASGNQRLVALALAEGLGPDSAIAWREWAKRPGFGAYARQWLASHGKPVAVNPADDAWLIVDGLSIMLDSLGDSVPPFLLAAAFQQELGADVDEMLAVLRSSDHPAADDIVARLEGPGLAPAGGTTGRAAGMKGLRRTAAGTDAVCQLKISLRNVSAPAVWRRVLVPDGLTLGELHYVILEAMGWDGGHMHMFSTRLGEYGVPDMELGHADESGVVLPEVLPKRGSKLLYTYDFGDDWEHDIRLEERRRATAQDALLSCVAGEGACPPDDCGGPWGYDNLKETMADPGDEQHEDMLDWLGLDSPGQFDPAAFSLDEVNTRLRRLSGS
ncbi:MAG TPA: plasmid pRiA4b ORF-3 family protein [Streptosporangiaceae bacterium]